MRRSGRRLGGKTYSGSPLYRVGSRVPSAGLLRKWFENVAGMHCNFWNLDCTGVRGLHVHLTPNAVPK